MYIEYLHSTLGSKSRRTGTYYLAAIYMDAGLVVYGIDFVIVLNSLLPHHDSKSNGLKSERQETLLIQVVQADYTVKHPSVVVG